MSNRGRPRKPNAELELFGSRNAKSGQIESEALKNPEIPPSFLNEKAKEHWRLIVPGLALAGTAKEADRSLLAMLCNALAKLYDNSVDADSKPIVSEMERRTLSKTILDISDRFGLNPLSRARSGVNDKGKLKIKQRPQ